jgi:hypothetical protein
MVGLISRIKFTAAAAAVTCSLGVSLHFVWLISQGPTPGPDAFPTLTYLAKIWGGPLAASLITYAIAAAPWRHDR